MVAESFLDADGETVERVRKAMGANFPVVVTHDFHGNLSQRLINHCDAFVAYRTCPHVDQRDCGHRAANIMHRMLHEGMKPKQALAKPPMIINIMVHDTSMSPLRPFMEETARLEQEPGILAVLTMKEDFLSTLLSKCV
jgi:microcystin degradation protein MlrC